MSTADFVTVGGTAAAGVTNASSSRKRTGLMRPSAPQIHRQNYPCKCDLDDAWRTPAQRAAQQLRACGSGTALPAIPGPAPALASFGEIAEKSPEERKIMALETIAEGARLWILSKPGEEEQEEEDN
ncbi:hypothetical protein EDB81DRAFT_848167 [Dactylonectria macrodidyma]|uniref:Uncharacterized protein n=1 Tax=Dactylonectria macrodidyma TaxID=307937 RepID=A0A9P9IF79_9HYPO|nr:hypothetical protein EDB81DRAFT_848167 [Dactylonectria macrodidyma]